MNQCSAVLCLGLCVDTTDAGITAVQLLRMPATWSFAQGAAFLVQSLTAYYGLKSLGNIKVIHFTKLGWLHPRLEGCWREYMYAATNRASRS